MLSAAHDILKEEQGGDKNNGTANTTVSRSLHDIAISVTFTGLKKKRRDLSDTAQDKSRLVYLTAVLPPHVILSVCMK